jgi:hypothetical protein
MSAVYEIPVLGDGGESYMEAILKQLDLLRINIIAATTDGVMDYCRHI